MEVEVGGVKLVCGDALKLINTVEDESVDLIFTDPPYDMSIYMPALPDGQKQVMAAHFKRVLKHMGNIALFTGYIDKFKWFNMLSEEGLKYRRELVWVYPNPAGFGRNQRVMFVMAHESILIFTKSEESYFNYDGIMERSWFLYPCFSGWMKGAEGNPKEDVGATPKPLRLCITLIKRLCPPGGLVLDPFAGLASFGVAALLTGRRYVGFEIREDVFRYAAARLKHFAKQRTMDCFMK